MEAVKPPKDAPLIDYSTGVHNYFIFLASYAARAGYYYTCTKLENYPSPVIIKKIKRDGIHNIIKFNETFIIPIDL